MTTPQRWQEIDRIFAAALDLEPAARAAFLDEACGGDELLRQEVESLLAHTLPESLISADPVHEATRLLEKRVSDIPNDRIGRYKISRTLGSGGMGRVYLGLDEQLNRPVAIKLLSNYDATEEERMRRFRQEALAAAALNHPGIAHIYEISEDKGNNFIAMEFVDGLTLRARMKAGELPLELVLDIAIQIASALSAAHAAGIIHRDIKPENVMVRADGLVKVLDFGIAKFTQADGNEKNNVVETRQGSIIGTAAYMSPEQARGAPIDTRSDIWSLGVILYEMIAGRPPFWGDTPMDVIAAVLERQPAPFSTGRSVALESLEPIVIKALQKERENRYQTATDLLTDLKRLRQTLDVGAKQTHSNPPVLSADPWDIASRQIEPKTIRASPIRTSEDVNASSSAEYLIEKIKRYKYAALVVLVIFMTAVGFLAYPYFLSPKSQPIESIAVMPFTNESGNADVEYLSDGMTDLLINSLSQVPHLSVKARSSVFRYKGKEVEPQRIASELSVQAILNGRVVQRGDSLTVFLSLVDARNGNQLWGEQYDRKVADLISLQREIARDVSQKLRARLSGTDEQRVTKNYTANAEAYQLYLKGRFHIFKLTPPEVKTGIQYLQQAIQLDPNYALAYVGLSEASRSLALGGEMNPKESLPKAKEAAQKAIEIDDALAEAHTALAVTLFWYDWNWNEAENQYQRALQLNPNSADTHLFYAHLLSNTARHAEALTEIKRARELDPYSPFLNTLEGQFLLNAGKVDEALVKLRETFELAPGFWFPHMFASAAYIEKGMFAEAIAEARLAGKLSSAQTLSMALEGYALAKSGKREEARTVLDELLKLSKERFVPPYHLALLYNGLGERDQALAWLERGFEQRDPKMAFLKVDPKWDNLRGDPRFADLMRRVGFSLPLK